MAKCSSFETREVKEKTHLTKLTIPIVKARPLRVKDSVWYVEALSRY